MGAGPLGIHRRGGISTQRQALDQGGEQQGTLAQGQVVQALVEVLEDPVVEGHAQAGQGQQVPAQVELELPLGQRQVSRRERSQGRAGSR